MIDYQVLCQAIEHWKQGGAPGGVAPEVMEEVDSGLVEMDQVDEVAEEAEAQASAGDAEAEDSMDSSAADDSMDSGAAGDSMDSGAADDSMDSGAADDAMNSGAADDSMDSGERPEPRARAVIRTPLSRGPRLATSSTRVQRWVQRLQTQHLETIVAAALILALELCERWSIRGERSLHGVSVKELQRPLKLPGVDLPVGAEPHSRRPRQ